MDSNTPTDRSTLPWEEEPANESQMNGAQPPPQDTASQPGQGQIGNPENPEQQLAFSIGTMFIIAPQGGGGADGNENENFINPFQPPVKRALKEAWDSFEDVASEQLPDQSCPICYDDMNVDEETRATRMPCGHIFGKNCLKIWLEDHCSCPLCRKEVPHETIGSSHPPILFIIPHSNQRPPNQGENAEQSNAEQIPAENTNPLLSLAQQHRPEGAEATPANETNEGTPTPPRIAFNRIRFVLAPHRTPQPTETASDSPSTPQPAQQNSVDSDPNAPSTEPAPSGSSLPRPPVTLTSLFNSFLSNPLDRNLPSMRTDSPSSAEPQSAQPAEHQNTEVGAARPIEPSTLVQPPNIMNFPPFTPSNFAPPAQPNAAQTPESAGAPGQPSSQFITFHGLPSLGDLPTVLESLLRPNGLLNLQNRAQQPQSAEGQPVVGSEGNAENMNEQEQRTTTVEPSEEDRARPEGSRTANPMIHIYFFRPPNADGTVATPTNAGETESSNVESNEDRNVTESGRDTSVENNENRTSLSSALPAGLRHLSEMGQRIVRRFQEEFENRVRQTTEQPQQEQTTSDAEASRSQHNSNITVTNASPSQSEIPSVEPAGVVDEDNRVGRASVSTPSEAVTSDGETSRVPSGASTPRMAAPVARRSVRHHPYSRPSSTKLHCQYEDQGSCNPNDRFLHFECGHHVHESCYRDSPENGQMDEVDEQCPKCRQQNEK
ncbi:sir antagonist, ubiquitin-protein ligase E3 [Schizosaccharomyces osmophilus]|uniref:Sir antagonist, ubiquitin-protein ligase E3 n=1 Tax=Schizosaccharomyces osmophilus TaxID=2545709 RepID=A0AAE9W709_9SCHI|nr:sir antagonist, ubiquitin-protein ligase E3 [Schizosaccharomyces osmophilus]WBW71111.1 sir antagonist, ubiquitin-protein ligase E3 [Schizosaccharomyces osmophilus]